MSLVDYPLFSWVVVIHSLHVSSFREARHQEIIFPAQSASGIVCNLCCSSPVLLRVLLPGATLGYHITNRQSRYITPARLKSAYTTRQVLASS